MPDLAMSPLAQEPELKRFLESIFHKKNIVGSFPLGYPLVSLYAIPQFWNTELVLAVCPDRFTIQKNLVLLKRQGIRFPEVAVLDGSQMPHEEREICNLVRSGQVHLLYVLPERFSSFLFLELIIRVPLRAVVVEQAQFLLEGFMGTFRYEKLWEGLSHLVKTPPLILLTQPLPAFRAEELWLKLGLTECEFVELPPPYPSTHVSVCRLFTEHQKFSRLLKAIQGDPSHRASAPGERGSTIIHTHDKRACEKLVNRLRERKIQHVYAYHPGITVEERADIESIFSHHSNAIVVTYGYDSYFLKPPRRQWLQVIYWNLPASLEEAFAQFFRSPGGEEEGVAGLLLYTKEDYQAQYAKLKSQEWEMETPELQKKRQRQIQALHSVRQWVLSMGCRYQSLLAFWHETAHQDVLPCGQCDTCQAPLFGGILSRFLLHWFY